MKSGITGQQEQIRITQHPHLPKNIGSRRFSLRVGALAVGVLFSVAAHSQSSIVPATTETDQLPPVVVNIPAQSLDRSLSEFRRQTGLKLSYSSDLVAGKMAPEVKGRLSADSALEHLLAGSNVKAVTAGSGQYRLVAQQAQGQPSQLNNVAGEAGGMLPVVTVTAGRDRVAEAVNPPTSVGSKEALSQREIPQSVSVVTQQQIQQQGVTSLDEAMKYVPGVTVLQSDSDRVQYYSRGFPIESFQYDGLPVFTNPNMSGTSATGSPNLAMYDRVEVLTGAAGLLNGFGAAGGAINLVRKHAPAQFTASGQLIGGTNSNRGAELDVGGPLNSSGTVRGLIVGSYQNQGLVQDSTWQRDKMLYGTLEADLTPNTLLRIGGSYSQRDAKDAWGGGPFLSNGQFADVPRSEYFGADWAHDRYQTTDAFVDLEHKLANGWVFKATGDYTYNKNSILNAGFYGLVDPATYTGQILSTNKGGWESNKNFEAYASGPVTVFGHRIQLTGGADYSKMDEYSYTLFGASSNLLNTQTSSIFNYDYPLPTTWSGNPATTARAHIYQQQYGFFTNARISIFDPLTLVVGGRVSWWNTSTVSEPGYSFTTNSSAHYAAHFTPYVGLIYDINKTYSAYVSYTSIFEPQFGYQSSAGQILPPLVGEQYEAGIKGEYLDGRVNASMAIYQLTQKNRALSDPNSPGGIYYIASGRARTRGIEFKVSGEILPGWDVSAGYTYNDSKYLDHPTSLDAISSPISQIAPTNIYTLWTNYRLPGKFSRIQIGGGLTGTSKITNNHYSTNFTQGGFFVADARISYQITKKDSISLNVNNIFNKDYYQNASFRGFGREAIVTLRAAY